MNDYTEGPWLVTIVRDEYGTTGYQILTHTHTLVSVDPKEFYDDGHYPETDDDGIYIPDEFIDCSTSKVANAHLISAAPELLKVAEEFIKAFTSYGVANTQSCGLDWTGYLAKIAGEAIAKAKGESE